MRSTLSWTYQFSFRSTQAHAVKGVDGHLASSVPRSEKECLGVVTFDALILMTATPLH
jgi:hypothetical protein